MIGSSGIINVIILICSLF